jgi:hypothetical protein
MPAAKNPHADKVTQLLELSNEGIQPQPGYPIVLRDLEQAFVHALNGATDEAERLLADAEEEIAKFDAIAERDFALLTARVHAVLAHK